MKKAKFAAVLVTFAFAAGCASARGSKVEARADPQVMLVGSFHLANANRDLINRPIENVLVPHRQEELEILVDNLARWRPTKIVLEWPRSDQQALDERYQAYLDEELELTAREQDQIGLRLAEELGHAKVYAVDWNENFPGERSDYDFMAWARENGQADRLNTLIEEGQKRLDRQAEVMRHQSIVEWYFDLNQPETRERDHRVYFDLATFGNNERNPGASWVGGWYGRNLRIFNNIRDVIEPGDRVLVLYGSGHTYLLDRFFHETELAQVVDALPYIR